MSSTTTSIGGDMANVMDQESTAAPHETSDSEPVEGIGTLLHTALNTDGMELEPSETLPAPTYEIDTASQEFWREVLSSETDHIRGVWDETIHSRVLKDAFHVFNMLRLSTMHGLRKEFARALCDILFVPDKEDQMRITAWAATLKPLKTFEQLQASRPAWLWQHCRRVIPPPNILCPLVDKLFMAYGALKDATTKLPLFNQQNWKPAKQIRELICQGFVSDPPGIPLYTIVFYDSKAGNLPVYRCSRSTNFTEGGVHTHLLSRLPKHGTFPEHLNACLCDFVLQHNLRVSFVFVFKVCLVVNHDFNNNNLGWNF
jgi:hypothetical protein